MASMKTVSSSIALSENTSPLSCISSADSLIFKAWSEILSKSPIQ